MLGQLLALVIVGLAFLGNAADNQRKQEDWVRALKEDRRFEKKRRKAEKKEEKEMRKQVRGEKLNRARMN